MSLLSQLQVSEPDMLHAERAMKSLVPGTELIYHVHQLEPILFDTVYVLKEIYGSAINGRTRWPFRNKKRTQVLRELSDSSRFHFNFWSDAGEVGARDHLAECAAEVLYTYRALSHICNYRLAHQVQEAAQLLDVCVPLGKRMRQESSLVLYWL